MLDSPPSLGKGGVPEGRGGWGVQPFLALKTQ